jgi:predicted esterase
MIGDCAETSTQTSLQEKPMTDQAAYEDAVAQINNAFVQGDYAAVVEMTDLQAERYPEQKAMLLYMKICAEARMDQKEKVYQTLENALKKGIWYSERALRESPSLKPLLGEPVYEALVQRSSDAAAAEKKTSEQLLVIAPEGGTPPYPLVFALHANGSSAAEASQHWQSLVSAGWIAALPQSPNALWKGTYNWEDEERAREASMRQFAVLCQQYSIDRDRVIVGGHSMGGKLAIELALRGEVPSRGFLAVAPYISEDDLTSWEEFAGPSDIKGVILFGENDETIPQESIYSLASRLEAQGIEVLVQHFEGIGHEFGAPIRQALSRAVDFILS